MEQFYAILWSVVGTILTGLATWVTVVITNWLNTKIKDKKLAKYASDVFQIVMGAVQTIQQTTVDTMKKEGRFTAKAAEEAKAEAYKIITSELTTELKEYISNNFGDIKEYLMNQIEAMIYQLKNN